ncbi:galaxin isoform X2 [Lingula anatina]|uniref:Galaxin isoform X2 n=1 Tax=Lingula anatina TaxID=7574 RepID=A0A1S3I7W8_LINAN|nr:galaxin isoform X2 [Lingula anatina]XP_013394352.1 galaxin isoform X2 [Lingula anatina]|eukprot:XP_013394351.1 galaxin isoform X2 [Lingula anatina]
MAPYTAYSLICLGFLLLVFCFDVKAETSEDCKGREKLCSRGMAGEGFCYNEDESDCCGGRVFAKTAGSGCCVNVWNMTARVYSHERQFCCNGTVYSSGSLDCCADVVFNTSTQVCCQGKIQKFTKGAMCCGTELKMEGQVCCSPQHQPRYAKVYNMPKENFICCGNGYINRTEYYCDFATYQPMKICSNNSVHKCCGNEAYDPRKATCCNKKVFHGKSEHWETGDGYVINHICCGGVPQSVNEEICCELRVHNRTATSQCCGTESIDTDEKVCCNGRPFKKHSKYKTKCCSDRGYYEDGEHLCCGEHEARRSVLYNVSTSDNTAKCCNTALFNSTESICCGGEVMKKMKKEDDSCCQVHTRYQTYNSKYYLCEKQGLVAKASHRQQCGRGRTIDTRGQLCCRGMIHPKPSSAIKCCGTKTFNSSNPQLLCQFGSLVKRPPRQLQQGQPNYRQRCGRHMFDTRRELCCRGVKYAKKSDAMKCCGTRLYNSSDPELTCQFGIRLQQMPKMLPMTTTTTTTTPRPEPCPPYIENKFNSILISSGSQGKLAACSTLPVQLCKMICYQMFLTLLWKFLVE